MQPLVGRNLQHVLAALLLLSRLGDLSSTYLVTPTLKLESNDLVRRLGWKYAILTLLIAVAPYYNPQMAMVILVPSLLVSASNISKIWAARTMGEDEYADYVQAIARRSKLPHALYTVAGQCFFIMLAGVTLWMLSPDPDRDWGYWFGLGLMAYAFAMGFHSTIYYVRLFRSVSDTRGGRAGVNAGSSRA